MVEDAELVDGAEFVSPSGISVALGALPLVLDFSTLRGGWPGKPPGIGPDTGGPPGPPISIPGGNIMVGSGKAPKLSGDSMGIGPGDEPERESLGDTSIGTEPRRPAGFN